jgi:uncharacterized protein (DUF486 family)
VRLRDGLPLSRSANRPYAESSCRPGRIDRAGRARTCIPTMTTSPVFTPVALLIASNIFMTFAWYGHLKFKSTPILLAILASWGIAFVEYCLAVPANRIGSAVYTTAELKTMQEVITLAVFAGFSVFYLNEPIGWNHAIGFTLIALGAFFVFQRW